MDRSADILIVEDSPTQAVKLQNMLERQSYTMKGVKPQLLTEFVFEMSIVEV